MATKTTFSEFVHKLQLLNPEANVMFSSKSNNVVWSEVPAGELVLPPCIEAVPEMSILNFPGGQVQVKNFGE